ncbi:MAG: 2-C-methyl-D-erythritol 2,4-cyclodiphosphate synthase [Ruminococcaceae bacterium]|nr:2-C-methyl-D-erythritol 2,4-cyclodiphosphate synthase [Oscillospiraceae bacterium]
MKDYTCTALIVAAGNSTRMSTLGNKQFLSLLGVPTLARTVMAFNDAVQVDDIIIVTKKELIGEVNALCVKYSLDKVSHIICGGESRQDSVKRGLDVIRKECFVAVHDGARPLILSSKIDEAIQFAKENGSAALGIPLSDTAKVVDENENITGTPDRSTLRLIQTPQIFPHSLLKRAYEQAENDSYTGTDDCSLVEHLGEKPKYIFGDYNNIKITTPEDILKAEAILNGGKKTMRTGFGYDVHALKEGRDLILGGVKIPHEKGLDGHSDADVLIHALMDALLGAAALGDIGKLFPDSDNSFKGIDSRILLRKVREVLNINNFGIGNVDITVAAQAPKLAPFIDEMRDNLSEDLGIDKSFVSVKATTTEHLGFEGRKEGISAYAICTIL